MGAADLCPFILELPWTVAMLFGMVMFTLRVHHMHQFGCISFHLLFLVSECGLSVENYDVENHGTLECLKHPAAQVNYRCLLVSFFGGCSWFVSISSWHYLEQLFCLERSCLVDEFNVFIHLYSLASYSPWVSWGGIVGAFWMFGRHQAVRLVPEWINWYVLSMCLIAFCASEGLLHYGVESHLFLYGRFMSLHTKWKL